MPTASLSKYTGSYTPSTRTYSTYGLGSSSYANRTTSLERGSYSSKASSSKYIPSSSYLNGNSLNRYSYGLPPKPSYSDTFRSTRTSPSRRTSQTTGGISEIGRESRHTIYKYRDSSLSRDTNSSKYSYKDRSTDSDYLKKRRSVERRDPIITSSFDSKPRVSDQIRAYESIKGDSVEDKSSSYRRRSCISPARDTNRNYRYLSSEQNGNSVSSYALDSKYSSLNNNPSRAPNGFISSRKSSIGSLRKRTDSSNSEDSKGSESGRSYLSNIRPSTEAIINSLKESKTSCLPPSPPPPPPVKDYSTSSGLKRERKKLSTKVQERVSSRLNNDLDDGASTKRMPSTTSLNFNENNGLVGLRNIGNTCYMNSIIQCLSNTRCLMEYMLKEGFNSDINTTLSSMKGDLVRAFANLLSDLWNGDQQSAVDTCALKSQIQSFAPLFHGHYQHDAQELLRKLLEGLHDDVNRVTVRPKPITTDIDDSLSDDQIAIESWKRYLRYDDSKIVDMFVGQLKSSLQCSVCGHRSVTFDPFWDLSLPIPSRTGQVELSQCLDLFTKEEVLDNDERPTCSRCKERRKMSKSFSIHKFPRVLVIHLKRFSPTERWRAKLSCNVDFPLDGLDLTRYASNASVPCRYNLIGVANHTGTTLSGHYTASCRHPYLGSWHEYNDSKVLSISANRVCSPAAYVLFYELNSS